MKYLDIKTVVNSYEGFQNCMTNKSWGYLALLKGCKSRICSSIPYEVKLDEVSNFLENIFNLSQSKRKYNGGRSLYVIFSKKWDNYFKYQGDFSPNIYDVAVWAYRRKSFSDDTTKEDILKIFASEFNIPIGLIENSFNTQSKNIGFSQSLYPESQLKTELNKLGVDVSHDNIDAKKGGVVASPGEISRGPFIQTLYAGLDITDYVIILQSDYFSLYGNSIQTNEVVNEEKLTYSFQQIFYGAPGTGKSHKIKKHLEGVSKDNIFRTTFHPDSDYSTFVGAYKPTTKPVPIYSTYGERAVEVKDADGNLMMEDRIVYEFVEQAFLQAYIKAWKLYAEAKDGKTAEKVYLIVEEINRGNCAQIFGDLFQLLDRDDNGFSEYPIVADKDLQKQLAKVFIDMPFLNAPAVCDMSADKVAVKIRNGEILLLPNNLYIWATMNTSDQSLFPIDSAFKRRWDWQYMPISDGKKGWQMEVNDKYYNWWQFLQNINNKIGSTTHSEDKKLGYYFCKATNGIINAETFVGKVIFYIWNDIFKDFAEETGGLFKDVDGSLLSFDKFYTIDADGKTKVVEDKVEFFLQNLGVEPLSVNTEELIEDEDGNEKSSTGKDYSKFSINGEGRWGKNRLATECVRKYVEMNRDMPIEEVLRNWKSLGNIVPNFIESKEEYEARTDNSKRSYAIPCGGSVIYVAHNGYGSNGKVFVLIEAVNQRDWGLELAKVEE